MFLQGPSTTATPEAHDPVAEHGPLPRRPRGDRPDGLPRGGRVLERSHRRVRGGGAAARRRWAARYLQFDDTSLAYLNDPSQREHDAPASAATPSTSTRPTSATSTRRSRGRPDGHGGDHPPVPWQLPLVLGGRGRLRLRRRGAVQRARGRRLLPRVRRRALGRLRAAALRAQGQAGRARARHHEARRSSRSKDELKRRIEEAAQLRRRSSSSACRRQCGFSSTLEGNALSRDEQIAKLRLVVETAEEVWST